MYLNKFNELAPSAKPTTHIKQYCYQWSPQFRCPEPDPMVWSRTKCFTIYSRLNIVFKYNTTMGIMLLWMYGKLFQEHLRTLPSHIAVLKGCYCKYCRLSVYRDHIQHDCVHSPTIAVAIFRPNFTSLWTSYGVFFVSYSKNNDRDLLTVIDCDCWESSNGYVDTWHWNSWVIMLPTTSND